MLASPVLGGGPTAVARPRKAWSFYLVQFTVINSARSLQQCQQVNKQQVRSGFHLLLRHCCDIATERQCTIPKRGPIGTQYR